MHGFDGIDVGQRIRVQLVHTDAGWGFIDFTGLADQSTGAGSMGLISFEALHLEAGPEPVT